PQTVRRRVAILHGQGDVGDAGTLVEGDDEDALLVAGAEGTEDDFPAAGVGQDVSPQLRDGGGDHGQVAAGETELLGEGTALLAGRDNVGVRTDGDATFGQRRGLSRHGAGPPPSSGRASRGPLPGPGWSSRLPTATPSAPWQRPRRAESRR